MDFPRTTGNNEVGAFHMTRDNLNIEGNKAFGPNTLSRLKVNSTRRESDGARVYEA